eukprot:Gb_14564 [translate_table: standard]
MGKSSKLIKCLILGAKAFSKHDEKDKLTKPKGKWSLGKPYSCIRDPNDDSQDQLHSENIVQIEHGISENGFSSATNSDLQPGITLTKPIEENSNIGLSNTLAKPDDSEEIAEDEGPVMENNGGVSAEDHAVTLIQAAFRGFLCRRAFGALRDEARVEAQTRGRMVINQTDLISLRCVQALVKVQARVRARQVRMSEQGQAVERHIQEKRQLKAFNGKAECSSMFTLFTYFLFRLRLIVNKTPKQSEESHSPTFHRKLKLGSYNYGRSTFLGNLAIANLRNCHVTRLAGNNISPRQGSNFLSLDLLLPLVGQGTTSHLGQRSDFLSLALLDPVQREIEVFNIGIRAFCMYSLEDWDHSTATVDELQAKIQNKQDAAMRRERALAYAFSQQLRICAQRENRTAVDCVDPEQPHLGWTWLERWMAARPSDKTEPEDDIMTMHLDANKHDKPLHGKSEKKKTTVTQPSPSPTRSMARNSIATGLASTTHCSLSRSPNKSGHESPLPARAINNCRDSEICHMGARKALTGNENENDGYVNEENCGSYGICAIPELAVTSTSTDASKLAGGRFKSSRSGSTNLRVPNYMSTTQSYKAKSTSPITPPNHTT